MGKYWKAKKVQRRSRYESIEELADYFKNARFNLEYAVVDSLEAIGKELKAHIKSKYGVQQPWFPPIGSNPTPLVDTGQMQNAVHYKTHGASGVEVFVSREQHNEADIPTDVLALVHEFGIMSKGVRVPVRAVWRPTVLMEIPLIRRDIERGLVNFFN